MALPTPNLDDRRFQDIVDECKRMIPQYCPDWTDHNVSDPGVALIELFAWMVDMLLYRVNQVPDKMYVTFLEMLGVQLEPPRSAQAAITFYLAAAQENELTIPSGTEVATVRTETTPATIFTTEQDLRLPVPNLIGMYQGREDRLGQAKDLAVLDLDGLMPNTTLTLFAETLLPGDAFWFAFKNDLSFTVLAAMMNMVNAGGLGIKPGRPPIVWEVWQDAGAQRWATCEVELEGTKGFNVNGEMILHLPRMTTGEFAGRRAFWLRCKLTDQQTIEGERYVQSPRLEKLKLETRGGTVSARHAVTVHEEFIGRSDGTPGQRFQLAYKPVLARSTQEHIVIKPAGLEGSETWVEVTDFASSKSDDRHYTLDNLSGEIMFGPTVLQPDGSAYKFGAIPNKGAEIRMTSYRYGGGIKGNVPANAIGVLKTAIPYVGRITNRQASVGGRDAQSLEDAKVKTPKLLRSRTRAVTQDDYEFLATSVHGVARALCQGPTPGLADGPKPGEVFVTILPHLETIQGQIAPELLAPSSDLTIQVKTELNKRRLIGTTVQVQPAALRWASVQAQVRVRRGSPVELLADVKARALEALYGYLNPYTGGPNKSGWGFGRELHAAEIVGVLQVIEGIEFVERLTVNITEPGSSGVITGQVNLLELPANGVICSGEHHVEVIGY
jgi:predicted phage baseplate assembly protein